MRAGSLLVPLVLAGLAAASPLQAGTREFKRLVKALRAESHCSPTGTGFLGFLARCSSPKGTRALHLAVFDDPKAARQLQAVDVEALLARTVGSAMAPVVRVDSRTRGEHTVIYAQPRGPWTELLIVSFEPDEVAVVSLEVDPATFRTWIEHPDRKERTTAGGTPD